MRMVFSSSAVFASIFLAGAASANTMTEVFGGPGGAPFSMTCGPGQYVVGFYARAGAWVDGIGLICAPYTAATGKLGAGSRKGYAGGRTGAEQEVSCAPGQPVTGIALVHTRGNGLKRQYVNTVAVSCARDQPRTRCISTGEGCGGILERESVGMVGSDPRPYDVLNCPAHEIATGIQGRSGNFVDAIGLICGPPPAPPPPPPAAATAPPIKKLGKEAAAEPPKPIRTLGKATIATASNDVDVYDSPVRPRKVIGSMQAGAKATVVDRHPDGWCKLKAVAAGQDGWVAYDHLTNCPRPD